MDVPEECDNEIVLLDEHKESAIEYKIQADQSETQALSLQIAMPPPMMGELFRVRAWECRRDHRLYSSLYVDEMRAYNEQWEVCIDCILSAQEPTPVLTPEPTPTPAVVSTPEPAEDNTPSTPADSETVRGQQNVTPIPTVTPTVEPTVEPTTAPTLEPTCEATQPTATPEPTPDPTPKPTEEPTAVITPEPTREPTAASTPTPTPEPILEILPVPLPSPIIIPRDPKPTVEPTPEPTVEPTPATTKKINRARRAEWMAKWGNSSTAKSSENGTVKPTVESTVEPTEKSTPADTKTTLVRPTARNVTTWSDMPRESIFKHIWNLLFSHDA